MLRERKDLRRGEECLKSWVELRSREECLLNWEEYVVEKSAYIIGKSRDWIKVSKELSRVAE